MIIYDNLSGIRLLELNLPIISTNPHGGSLILRLISCL